jgi:hypothetical protein
MTIRTNIATILAATVLGAGIFAAMPARAEDINWRLQPRDAFFDVYAFYCAPVEIIPARASTELPQVPTGIADQVYTDLLAGSYGGNCQAFYVNELLPRADTAWEAATGMFDQ